MASSTGEAGLLAASSNRSRLVDRLDQVVAERDGGQLAHVGRLVCSRYSGCSAGRVLRRHLTDPLAFGGRGSRLARSYSAARSVGVVDTVAGSGSPAAGPLRSTLLRIGGDSARRAVLVVAERDGVPGRRRGRTFPFGPDPDRPPNLREPAGRRRRPGRCSSRADALSRTRSAPTPPLLEAPCGAARSILEFRWSGKLPSWRGQRSRSMAHGPAAAPLSDEQNDDSPRCRRSSARGLRACRLDPEVLGRLVIRVVDELIDGSVAARLARARPAVAH